MKFKNVLLVLSGFAGGIAAVWIFVKKLLGVVCKSQYLLTALKDHWIDLFIKLLYASDTDDFIERKLREEGYVRHKYRPCRYTTYSNWKGNSKGWDDDEAWNKWRDDLKRRMGGNEEDE